jgi:Na+-transporting methylmalonyl-CoA/oxaloacetate decarboxylase gamma subunit
MEVDWGQAFQIGGIGFSLVFAVLLALASAIWLVALLLNKVFGGTNIASEKKESQKS